MKKLLFAITLIALFFFLGKTLNPFDRRMFYFHDDTQVARVEQFTLNLTNGIIPPRFAPDISYKLGFPVFNFYAPLSYWIATAVHLAGLPSPLAVKAAFLLAVLSSFIFMLAFLRLFFKLPASLLGAVAYTSSLWVAVEIFVRGNLAEIWFIALLPLGFYFLTLNTRNTSKLVLVLTSLILGAVFTVHNVFSLLAVGLFLLYAFLLPHKRRNVVSLLLGLGLGAYFLIPAVLELRLTYAAYVATKTHYWDHFLCAWQIWKSTHWGYGGSAPGCMNDDMAFTLGKIHIILGAIGFILFGLAFFNKRKNGLFLYFGLMGIVGAFLTLYASKPIWDVLSPVFSLFQFPWRFLIFPMFGLAFFTAYGLSRLPEKLAPIVSLILIVVLLATSSKFFSKPWLLSNDEYLSTYGNSLYMEEKAGYNMAEYLPRTADYTYWRSLEGKHPDLNTNTPAFSENTEVIALTNEPFKKEVSVKKAGTVTVNVHYFPFWTFYINNNPYIPRIFDRLGRPVIGITTPSIIHVIYDQTIPEQTGNAVTMLAFLVLVGILLFKPVWIKRTKSRT